MRKNTVSTMILTLALGLPLAACQDTKTLKENEQLKTHVAELEKSNADLESRIDGLTKENAALAADNEKLKQAAAPKKKSTKAAKGKHHKAKSKRSTS
jgi:regulator of replication initiation timing